MSLIQLLSKQNFISTIVLLFFALAIIHSYDAMAYDSGQADSQSDSSLVVVVNRANPIQSLSKKEIVDMYMGRYQSFPDGTPVLPIDFPNNSEVKARFYKHLVNQSEKRINSYWSRLLFSGRARPPRETKLAEQVAALLQQNNDAIAYLPKHSVTEDMKIVFQF